MDYVKLFLYGCLVTLQMTAPALGYIWNLAWSNSNVDSTYNDNSPHPRNVRRTDWVRGTDDIEENTTERFVPCRSDRSCGRGKFCDRHYGTCTFHREAGDVCRRDGHCQRGHDCMFGRCQKAITAGLEGARCKHEKDCGVGLCCARKHGEKVCKKKLALGQKCYVPRGGLAYSVNEVCPCDVELTCKNTSKKKTEEEEETWRFWTDFDHMRCAPV